MLYNEYKEKYSSYLNQFNVYLEKNLNSLSQKKHAITEAMRYAVEGGGKRIRPVLCLATNDMLGGAFDSIKDFALAIEYIHSYSLIHDDLPAMDNDDYRRGKLSVHKKFGEAMGILTGDALLNFAFETCLNKKDFDKSDLEVLRIIANCAGIDGMITGQVLDLQNEKNQNNNENTLFDIYLNKTSKLIMASLLVSSVKNNSLYYSELESVGKLLGLMFQITDDILDVESSLKTLGKTPKKDEKECKYTSIKIYGINGAKRKTDEILQKILAILKKIPKSKFLQQLAISISKRQS